MDKEALVQLRSFTSHVCRNDRHLLRITESVDTPETDLAILFDDTAKVE